jgi:hypothetical protein
MTPVNRTSVVHNMCSAAAHPWVGTVQRKNQMIHSLNPL